MACADCAPTVPARPRALLSQKRLSPSSGKTQVIAAPLVDLSLAGVQ